MKLGDVRSIDPEVVLFANPVAKVVALHRLGANLEWHFSQDLLRQVKVFESVLPALFVRPLCRATLARQGSALLQKDVFAHEVLAFGFDFVITVRASLETKA